MRADLWVRPLAADTGVWVGRLDPEVVAIAEQLFGVCPVESTLDRCRVVFERMLPLGEPARLAAVPHLHRLWRSLCPVCCSPPPCS